MYKYGIIPTMEKEISKRQRKKRGKVGTKRVSSSIKRTGREVGFAKGKWVQVYAQAAAKTYWIKVAQIEEISDEDSKFF